MTTEEAIIQGLKMLPPAARREVLDFTEFLITRSPGDSDAAERREWSELSLAGALGDMQDEPELYDLNDLKERFR
jgi:hypothetical protein